MSPDTFADIPGDDAHVVLSDVVLNVPPEKSRISYTPALRRYRAAIEAEIAALPPGTIIDIPNELPRLDIAVPE